MDEKKGVNHISTHVSTLSRGIISVRLATVCAESIHFMDCRFLHVG